MPSVEQNKLKRAGTGLRALDHTTAPAQGSLCLHRTVAGSTST
jgi:hypothetical protein